MVLSRTIAFRGNHGWGGYNTIAAGRNVVVAHSESEVGILTKDGALIDRRSIRDLFSGHLPEEQGTADPRISYDTATDRFVIMAASSMNGCGPCPNVWLIAVSKTNDPRTVSPADWHVWSFDGTRNADGAPTNLWGDYHIAGFDDDKMILTAQMVRNDGAHSVAVCPRIWVFDKAELLTGDPDLRPRQEFCAMKDPRTGMDLVFRVLPATQWEDPGGIFFVYSGSECDIIVGRVDGKPSGAQVTLRNVHVPPPGDVPGGWCGTPHPGEQLGGGLPIFLHSAHIRDPPQLVNGTLWVVQNVRLGPDGQPGNALRLVALDVRGWPGTPTIREDTRIGIPATSLVAPALAVDAKGNIAMVVNLLNRSIYPSVFLVGRLGNDPPGSMRPFIEIQAGEANFNYSGVGDAIHFGAYSGAALDPVDGSAWVIGQYAARKCTWGVVVSHVRFEESGTPGIPSTPTEDAAKPCSPLPFGISPYEE